jgi:hypothetical protein
MGDACVTSPAYWLQRDYEAEGQMGLEPTSEEYINQLIRVFDEAYCRGHGVKLTWFVARAIEEYSERGKN